MLNTADLEQFKKMLHMIQARFRGDVAQIEEEAFSGKNGGDHGSSNHMAEMGTDAWDLDFSLRIVENDHESMKEISKALSKIDDGTYGLCEMCVAADAPTSRSWIPKARLRALPYARNCMACERKLEDGD